LGIQLHNASLVRTLVLMLYVSLIVTVLALRTFALVPLIVGIQIRRHEQPPTWIVTTVKAPEVVVTLAAAAGADLAA